MRVLVGYDGTDAAKNALELARRYAKELGARIVVCTSLVGDSQEQIEGIEKAEHDLAYAQAFLNEEGISCETKLLSKGASVGENIVYFAEEIGADEIIIGVVQKSKVGKFIFGSTAQYVILKAHCPVLTVK